MRAVRVSAEPNRELAGATTVNDSRSFATSAANPIRSPSSHSPEDQSCAAIVLAPAAPRVATPKLRVSSRASCDNHSLDAQQLGKIFSVSRFDFARVADALNQFIS